MATEKRLISLDEALEATHREVFWTESEAAAVRSFLVKQPKLDAVEVVHGRWEFSHTTTVEKYDVVKCSNCGHEAFAIAIYVKEGHYCPHCGARMDRKMNGTA